MLVVRLVLVVLVVLFLDIFDDWSHFQVGLSSCDLLIELLRFVESLLELLSLFFVPEENGELLLDDLSLREILGDPQVALVVSSLRLEVSQRRVGHVEIG